MIKMMIKGMTQVDQMYHMTLELAAGSRIQVLIVHIRIFSFSLSISEQTVFHLEASSFIQGVPKKIIHCFGRP